MFEAEKQSLREIIAYNGFSIPEYQRGYAWEDVQLAAFWLDLTDLYSYETNAHASHFLGSLVVIDHSDGSLSRLEVVDGQQRLTSVVLLLIAIRDYKLIIGEKKIAAALKALEVSRALLRYSAGDTGEEGLRLLPTDGPARDLLRLLSDEPTHIRGHKVVRPATTKHTDAQKKMLRAYEYFCTQIGQLLQAQLDNRDYEKALAALTSFEDALLDHVLLLQVTATSTNDAYRLFETLNDRGKSLTPSELLKNKLLSCFDASRREEISVTWKRDIETILSGKGKLDAFLRHYLLAVTGRPVRKQDIYSSFARLLDEAKRVDTDEADNENSSDHTSGALDGLLEELVKAATYYSWILGTSSGRPALNWALEDLKKTSVTSHNLLAVAGLLVFPLSNGTTNPVDVRLLELLSTAEHLSLRWIICGMNAQVLENHYRRAAEIYKREDLIEDLDVKHARVLDLLRSIYPESSVVSANLAANEPPKKEFTKYILLKIEKHYGLQTSVQRSTSVDTISSQVKNMGKYGNLAIIEESYAEAVRDRSWQQKAPRYRQSDFNMTACLADLDAWDDELVASRSKWLGEALAAATEVNSRSIPSFPEWRMEEGNKAFSKPQVAEDHLLPSRPEPIKVSLADLYSAGLLCEGDSLISSMKGFPASAEVLEHGNLRVDGRIFDTPSAAAQHVCKRPTNGWEFWLLSKDGILYSLDSLRSRFRLQAEASEKIFRVLPQQKPSIDGDTSSIWPCEF